jgi:hypothetical protein
MVELLKPIVDKYSFLIPRDSFTIQLKELSETELNELFVKKPESKKPESKKPEKEPEKEPESKKPESKKPESKKPESKKPESKKPESKKPESKKPESKKPEKEPEKKPESKNPEPKPKEGGRKVEETPQIEYEKGMPSKKRQEKLENRERQNMEKEEIIEKSLLKMELEAKQQAAKELEAKQQAAKELEAKQQATKRVALENYISAEIEPINKKIKIYSDEIKKILASANYTDTTFDILTAIDVEQLYSSIQRDFGAFVQREDGKFKYMFNYEPDIEQSLIKQEYQKTQCILLFIIGYLNDILSKSGVDYAKYILKGGGAMKLRLAEILAGEQTQPLFFSNDIDVKTYLNPTKFAKVVDLNFLRIYQFGLSLIISKIFRELIIHDLMMLKFFPKRSILKMQIYSLEPDTQPLASKIMSRGSTTAVFKISLQFAGKIIPIADIDPSPPSEIGIPTTQDLIVDKFAPFCIEDAKLATPSSRNVGVLNEKRCKSQELKFYVDNFSEFVDDKIKYYQLYYNTYLQNPQDDYVSKTFRKFLKYINLFIQLTQIRPLLFNEQQKKDLNEIEKQKDLEKIEEKLQKQMEEKLKQEMEENLKRLSSNPYLNPPPPPAHSHAVQSSNLQPPQPKQGDK